MRKRFGMQALTRRFAPPSPGGRGTRTEKFCVFRIVVRSPQLNFRRNFRIHQRSAAIGIDHLPGNPACLF